MGQDALLERWLGSIALWGWGRGADVFPDPGATCDAEVNCSAQRSKFQFYWGWRNSRGVKRAIIQGFADHSEANESSNEELQ